jgi:glycosyltransferase involved in cell wall biosynthesis
VLGQGRLEAELRAMVPERLKERVIFGGFVDEPSRCWAVMRCCHVLVHLADHEPWGLIINEAVALGLAVVSSDVVGASLELVRDGVNGRLVPRDDDPATAAAAMLEVSAPDRLVAMSAAGADILAYWRHTADPIEGLKQALQFAGVAL